MPISLSLLIGTSPPFIHSPRSQLIPVTRINTYTRGSQRVKWNVAASADGNLIDLSSGRELSYLFWEAVSHYSPPSPSLSAIDGLTNQASTAFNPSRPILNSNNSILLPFTEFIAYLDDTLKLLILHVSARNDFITYWLPHFVAIHEKGQSISMRFLEQVDYEKAAILDITPLPDFVIRVFMLFKGVDSDEIGWEEAKERVGIIDWRVVVGIKEDFLDLEKFRVLEWGGMEVV